MNGWQIFIIVFCALGLIQSLFLGIYLLVRDRFNFNTFFYLGLMLCGLAFRLAKSYFIFIPQRAPHWGVVLGAAGLWMIGPGFYLYTRSLLTKPKRLVFIHFLPALLIVVMSQTNYVYYIGMVHMFVYLALGVYEAAPWRDDKIPPHFILFATSTGIILSCFIAQASVTGIAAYATGTGIAVLVLYVINFLIVRDSQFFPSATRKSKVIDKKVVADIIDSLEKAFCENKLYRNKGLTIAAVSQQIRQPAYLVSQSINQHYNIRFNEWVNRHRVNEVKERLRNTAGNEKIETLAKEVGFSSMSSLYEAFRKETQLTPQRYREQFSTT